MSIAIIVHGGAGDWTISAERREEALRACETAAERGRAILMDGG